MRREQARQALLELYAGVDLQVAAAGPVCHLSGRCCDFPVSGHVLYASALEVELVRTRHEPPTPEQPGWCPFYRARRCTLRDLRPLGCRIYFCDPDYERDQMAGISATAHHRLKQIHDDHGLAYRYAPFVDQLAAGDSA